jgi:hypothetical protein
VEQRVQRPKGSAAFRWLTVGCILCALGLAALAGSRGLAFQDATPTPDACGEPVTAWGDASTNDVTVTLTTAAPDQSSPVASPVASPIAVANPGEDRFMVRLSNHGTETAKVLLPDVKLTLCDGRSIAPNASAFAEPEVQIPANEAVEIDLVFSHDPMVPARSLTVPVSTETLSAGTVEFVLRLVPTTSGDGENVTGANAVGGDGADGQNAGSATPAGGT